jgi:hypothetical protein
MSKIVLLLIESHFMTNINVFQKSKNTLPRRNVLYQLGCNFDAKNAKNEFARTFT